LPSSSADDMKTSGRPIGQYCEGSCYGLVKVLSYSNREKTRQIQSWQPLFREGFKRRTFRTQFWVIINTLTCYVRHYWLWRIHFVSYCVATHICYTVIYFFLLLCPHRRFRISCWFICSRQIFHFTVDWAAHVCKIAPPVVNIRRSQLPWKCLRAKSAWQLDSSQYASSREEGGIQSSMQWAPDSFPGYKAAGT